jgi:hypothetical protein
MSDEERRIRTAGWWWLPIHRNSDGDLLACVRARVLAGNKK